GTRQRAQACAIIRSSDRAWNKAADPAQHCGPTGLERGWNRTVRTLRPRISVTDCSPYFTVPVRPLIAGNGGRSKGGWKVTNDRHVGAWSHAKAHAHRVCG